jgi:hypothetical protein
MAPTDPEDSSERRWNLPPSVEELFEPPTADQLVWRYMDLAKFAWMLENRALYFCRSDLIGDPFEGSMPVLNATLRALALERLQGMPREQAERASQQLEAGTRLIRREIYLNCWHMNEHESAAMWRLYAAGDQAIALRSTYRRLRDCLPERVHIGKVRYIDFMTDVVHAGNIYSPYAHKRASFAHERELRAIYWDRSQAGDEAKPGTSFLVDLPNLIEVVHVAPTLPDWVHRTVEALTRKYELEIPVLKSAMNRDPMY